MNTMNSRYRECRIYPEYCGCEVFHNLIGRPCLLITHDMMVLFHVEAHVLRDNVRIRVEVVDPFKTPEGLRGDSREIGTSVSIEMRGACFEFNLSLKELDTHEGRLHLLNRIYRMFDTRAFGKEFVRLFRKRIDEFICSLRIPYRWKADSKKSSWNSIYDNSGEVSKPAPKVRWNRQQPREMHKSLKRYQIIPMNSQYQKSFFHSKSRSKNEKDAFTRRELLALIPKGPSIRGLMDLELESNRAYEKRRRSFGYVPTKRLG